MTKGVEMQARNIKKSLLFLNVLLFAVAFLVVGGFAVMSRSFTDSTPMALTSGTTSPIKVFKVNALDKTTSDGYTPGSDVLHTATEENTANEIIYDGTSIPFVVLNTDKNADSKREAIYVSIGNQGTIYYDIISVKITYNDTLELTVNSEGGTRDDIPESNTYQQYMHGLSAAIIDDNSLNEKFKTKDKNGNTLSSPEGKYTLELSYRPIINGSPGITTSANFSFYLLTDATYSVTEEKPGLDYTEKVIPDDSLQPTQHYFKNTNEKTSDKAGVVVSSLAEFHYPELTYNPEKFKLSYTRTLYNYKETVNLTFSTTGAGAAEKGILTTTVLNGTTVISTTSTELTKTNGIYIASVKLDQLGDYVLTKKLLLKIGTNNYITADKITITDTKLLQAENLSITGFAAEYANLGNSSAPFKNDEIASDFTYLNPALTGDNSALSKPSSAPTIDATSITVGSNVLAFGTLPSTNQAPVWLNYSATLNPTSGKSWYIYKPLTGNATISNFTLSTQFSSPGTYFVYLSFKNSAYVNGSSSSESSSQGQEFTAQFIAFKITNTAPVVSIQATDSNNPAELLEANTTTLSSLDYTNKNVYIKWNKPGAFDAPISATYSRYDYGNNTTPQRNQQMTGMQWNGKTETANSDATLFTENGKYTVQVYHTNSANSYIIYQFTIDKTALTGIKAVAVNTVNGQIDNNAGVISTQDNFNLTTNKPFAWTWTSKTSGAAVTAKYAYASLSNIDGYSNTQLLKDSDGEVWVSANGKFGLISALMDYNHTDITKSNYKFNPSQIISTARVAILLLSDEAGNTAAFVTILDTVKPEMLQQIDGTGESNRTSLISKTTKFTWGSHKALGVERTADTNRTDLDDLLDKSNWEFAGSKYIVSNQIKAAFATSLREHGGNLYFTTEIDKATINSSTADTGAKDFEFLPQKNATTGIWSATSAWVIVKQDEASDNWVSYLSSTKDGMKIANSEHIISDGTKLTDVILTFNCTDKAGAKMTPFTVQVSLDRAQSRMFNHYGTVDNTEVTAHTNRTIMFSGNSTNRQYLTFSFLQQTSGIFRVETVTLDFYPLNFDTGSVNFPYGQTSTTTVLYNISGGSGIEWATWTGDEGSNYMHSNALSYIGFDASLRLPASQEGMYVFKRSYSSDFVNAPNEDQQGDVANAEYTVFVDRTGVISFENNDLVVGGDISLKLGNSTTGYTETPVTFKNWALHTQNSTEFARSFFYGTIPNNLPSPNSALLSSNILPASIVLPTNDYNKYSALIENLTLKNTFNMKVQVIVQRFSPTGTLEEQTLYSPYRSTSTSDGDYTKTAPIGELASGFNIAGWYRVMLFDTSNLTGALSGTWDELNLYTKATFAPNNTVFTLKVNSTKPSAVAQHKIGASNFTTATAATGATLRSDDINTKTVIDYITGAENSRFTFSDTTDPYAARIAYNDVIIAQTVYGLSNAGVMTKLTSTNITLSNVRTWDSSASDEAKKALFSDEEIARINGATGTNSALSLSSKATSGGVLYYRVLLDGTTDRYQYYILLPSIPTVSGYQKIDCQYRLEYHYIGSAEDYGESAYQNSTTLYIDKVAPYKNLLALVNNDRYLTTTQKSEIIANLNNPDYDFLKTYAFAVNSGFKFTSISSDPSENQSSSYYYRAYSGNKYTDESYTRHQTAVPGRTALPGAIQFNELSTGTFILKTFSNEVPVFANTPGYYDIIERDAAGNYTVYTIFVVDSASGMTMEADGTAGVSYSMKANKDGLSINSISGAISTPITNQISAAAFAITSLNTDDAWYSIRYRNVTTNSSANWNTLEINPNSESLSAQLSTLNGWIESAIASGAATTGTRIEIDILNRAGININFFILSPGPQIVMKDYIVRVGDSFTFTFIKDSNSTKYSNFKIMENGSQKTGNINGKPLSDLNNRGVDHTFSFNAANQYVFSFQDNFGRQYSYTYPTSADLVSEFVFATGSTAKLIDGIQHTSSNTDFRYTTDGNNTELSITITDRDSNTQILSLVGKTYNELVAAALLNGNSDYFTVRRDTTSRIATISFKAIYNHHYIYTVQLKDEDGNFTFSQSFGTYTKLPTVSLADTSGIVLWEDIFNTAIEKNTSKQVVIKWVDIADTLGINPRVTLERKGIKTTITSPYTVREADSYIVRVESDLGVLSTSTVKPVNFSIKSYDTSVYGVYYNNVLLNAHTELLEITTGTGTGTVTRKVAHYFFLADAPTAWNNLKVVANENKYLNAEWVKDDGNTKIYRVYGNNTHILEEYFAVTRIPSANNNLTTFNVYKYTSSDSTGIKANDPKDYSLQLFPSNGTSSYAHLTWPSSYTDTSNNKTYANFVYLDLSYNGESVGTFTSGSIRLTESGQYTIKLYDAVDQRYYFGSATPREYFTLTLLNNVIFYVNNSNPIQNATYNDPVTISLVETSLYDLSTLTATVLLDGKPYSEYISTSTAWTFSQVGHYKVALSVHARTTGSPLITGTLNFTIIDKEESRSVYEFAKISGYIVTKIEKLSYSITGEPIYQNITNQFLSGGSLLYNFKLDTTNPGVGRYRITVSTQAREMNPSQTYSYIVWLNDENPAISPSREFGTTETSPVTVLYNPGLLYQQVGKSYITVNGERVATVTSNSAMQPETFSFSAPDTYLVQIYSESGTLLLSQRITISVPLNSAAIILIILGCLAVLAVIITFVILRTRMRIK